MARVCKITGKRTRTSYNVSKANNHTKRKHYPNLINKKIFVPSRGKKVLVRVSAKALKIMNKIGVLEGLKKANLRLKDIAKGSG